MATLQNVFAKLHKRAKVISEHSREEVVTKNSRNKQGRLWDVEIFEIDLKHEMHCNKGTGNRAVVPVGS